MAVTPNAAAPEPNLSSEFTVDGGYVYNHASPVRWIVSHIYRVRVPFTIFVVTGIITTFLNALIPAYTGRAFDDVLGDNSDPRGALVTVAFILLAIVILRGVFDLLARFAIELSAKRLERNARQELFVSLLGKSQTFHNRQQVGDLMARADQRRAPDSTT